MSVEGVGLGRGGGVQWRELDGLSEWKELDWRVEVLDWGGGVSAEGVGRGWGGVSGGNRTGVVRVEGVGLGGVSGRSWTGGCQWKELDWGV